jgi:hypothetical protein
MVRLHSMTGPAIRTVVALMCGLTCLACDDTLPPDSSFYDQRIGPVLDNSCARQTGACHLDDGTGRAMGNLDLGSFDALMRRRDVLPPHGPYSLGVLLLKGGAQVDVPVETLSGEPVRITTDIRHNAGQTIALGSSGFAEIKRWIETGFTRTGVAPTGTVDNIGACRNGVGTARGFHPTADPADAEAFEAFVRDVQPTLLESCAGGACHGSEFADLYLTCGDTEEERRWNFFVTVQHLNTPASTSELLRRPLAALRGGTYHEGGDVFAGTDDPGYQRLAAWAEDVVGRRPDLLQPEEVDEGLAFFADRVQPALVRKGCMFLNCHSPAMFHDLRLRGGSQGTFSRIATHENYEISRLLMGLESDDPNQARMIAKNLFRPSAQAPGSQGLAHRGGALFEDFGGQRVTTPEDCAPYDVDGGDLDDVPAYCILVRWHQIERARFTDALAARGVPEAGALRGLVWVRRPPGTGDVRDFDTFRGGADLLMAPVTVDAGGDATLGETVSLLGGCGLGAAPDVRNPTVDWDADRIAFAARSSASEPLRLHWVRPDGSDCGPIPGVAPARDEENGILTHDFDPAFAPDGRLVFASTRGNLDRGRYPYEGPTRTPAAMQPNANLYLFDPSGADLRQLTFLLNQEVSTSFMADGRVIFTTEKREPDFHMLALRRQNLDGGDYHPLFAQRHSVGFDAATEVVELPNRNLAFVAAPLSASDGAGTIVLVNRSIGIDQGDRDPDDLAHIHAMTIPAAGVRWEGFPDVPVRNARDRGVFRSPTPLPTGRLVVSCALEAQSLTAGPYAFNLCELDPASGALRTLGGDGGTADVEAVAVYARPALEVFASRPDEANGTTRVVAGEHDAVVHVLDMQMMASLLFSNTREGRPLDPRIGGFEVLEVRPPPPSATSFADVAGDVVEDAFGQVFVDYRPLGGVPLHPDGSAKIRLPGGLPFLLRMTNAGGSPLTFLEGAPFEGEMIQREQMQFYPGERANQSLPRRFFNGLCGGCHGSLSGRELDVAVDVDVLTGASRTMAYDDAPVSFGF